MKVRAFYRAAAVGNINPPYNLLSLKVFYPAKFDQSEGTLNFGIVPADTELAPFPVVIFFSGVNVSAESYQWLAVKMAEKGLVFITFNWVTDTLPGNNVGLTPGVDLQNLTPETFGKSPSGSAISTLLKELEKIQESSILKGMLDLNRIIFGGHSAGGSIALLNANPEFFPSVIGAFAYGAHTQGAVSLGFPPETFLPLSPQLPFLIAGGTNDGVISASVARYGKSDADCVAPLIKTYKYTLTGERNDRFLCVFNDANHFLAAHPIDETTGRSYLDNPSPPEEEAVREAFFSLTYEFISSACLHLHLQKDFLLLANKFIQNGIISKFEPD